MMLQPSAPFPGKFANWDQQDITASNENILGLISRSFRLLGHNKVEVSTFLPKIQPGRRTAKDRDCCTETFCTPREDVISHKSVLEQMARCPWEQSWIYFVVLNVWVLQIFFLYLDTCVFVSAEAFHAPNYFSTLVASISNLDIHSVQG